MPMISTEMHEGVLVIRLNRGATNALNLSHVQELSDTIGAAKRGSDTRSVVLTSSNEKFFTIGFDIPELFGLERDDFTFFYRTFNRLCLDLFTLPKPTVAALAGHAIAGGCILAICCDYRFMAEGRKLMGLNEIKLGVPVPFPTDCILRSLVGTQMSRDIVESGDFFGPAECLRRGLVDKVHQGEEVTQKAIEKAKLLGSYDDKTYAMMKRNRTESVEAEILMKLEQREEFFVERWYSDEARARLREAMEKF